MSTYTQILYQIVFSTKNRENVLDEENHEKFFRYTWGILKNKDCILYQINGVEDHIHLALYLHPSVALANLVKDIKVSTSIWIKEEGIFPRFTNWQVGYGAFTYFIEAKPNVVNYIKRQKEHHKKVTFRDEYIRLLQENGINFDERFLL